MQAGLVPGVAVGGGTGPGCFTHTKGIQISTSQLFWWEVRPKLLGRRQTLRSCPDTHLQQPVHC